MLLRLCAPHDVGLTVRVCSNTRYQCLFFVFRHQDNFGHPQVGGWAGSTLTLPSIRDNQRFTSLIELFSFLNAAAKVPRDWDRAFRWVAGNLWDDTKTRPFTHLLRTCNSFVHEEPPYRASRRACPVPVGTTPQAVPMSTERYCRSKWEQGEPMSVYTNPNRGQTRNLWKRFLTHHRIVDPGQLATLFPSTDRDSSTPSTSAPTTLDPDLSDDEQGE